MLNVIGDPMRSNGPTRASKAKCAISTVVFSATPCPATISFYNLRPEAFRVEHDVIVHNSIITQLRAA